MGAAGEGIVEHGDVAGLEGEGGAGGSDGGRHGAEMHGHVVAHGEDFAGGVVDRAGIIAAFFDVGGKSGAAEGRAHFFGDGVKNIFKDFEALRDRVGSCCLGMVEFCTYFTFACSKKLTFVTANGRTESALSSPVESGLWRCIR